jgi:hypothetical protein
VDGAGSGLDADLLDGNHASAFAAAIHTHAIGDVTGLQTALDGKAATVHTHAIGDVTGLQTALDGKAATVHTHAIGDVTGLQTALDGKVDENSAITGATKTKITYDAKGLVTAGADAAIADITGLQTALDGKTDDAIVVNSNTTAANDQLYHVVASATFTDPTPAEGKGYVVFVRNGTATVGGTGYSTAGQLIRRVFHSGAWANYLYWASTIPTAGIADDAVTNSKLANMDTARFKARITAGSGDPEDLTGTQATTLLDNFTSSLKGLAPASGGGTTNFLRADGTWAAPAGGGSSDVTVLAASNSQTGPVNTTTETAVFSFTLPTDLAAGEMLELQFTGLYLNNSGAGVTFTSRYKIGATTLVSHAHGSIPTTSAQRTFSGTVRIFIESTTAQRLSVMSFVGVAAPGTGATINNTAAGFNTSGMGEGTEDTTTAKTFEVTMQFGTANANTYCYFKSAQLTRYAAP